MGIEIAIALSALLLLIGTFWILVRQPHPDDATEEVSDDGGGPTEEPYPPGSRPGGPGSESQAVGSERDDL